MIVAIAPTEVPKSSDTITWSVDSSHTKPPNLVSKPEPLSGTSLAHATPKSLDEAADGVLSRSPNDRILSSTLIVLLLTVVVVPFTTKSPPIVSEPVLTSTLPDLSITNLSVAAAV